MEIAAAPRSGKPAFAYPIEEFMRAFGIGRTKTYEEINAGRLKVRKIGRKTVVGHDDAVAWFSSLPAREPSKAAA